MIIKIENFHSHDDVLNGHVIDGNPLQSVYCAYVNGSFIARGVVFFPTQEGHTYMASEASEVYMIKKLVELDRLVNVRHTHESTNQTLPSDLHEEIMNGLNSQISALTSEVASYNVTVMTPTKGKDFLIPRLSTTMTSEEKVAELTKEVVNLQAEMGAQRAYSRSFLVEEGAVARKSAEIQDEIHPAVRHKVASLFEVAPHVEAAALNRAVIFPDTVHREKSVAKVVDCIEKRHQEIGMLLTQANCLREIVLEEQLTQAVMMELDREIIIDLMGNRKIEIPDDLIDKFLIWIKNIIKLSSGSIDASAAQPTQDSSSDSRHEEKEDYTPNPDTSIPTINLFPILSPLPVPISALSLPNHTSNPNNGLPLRYAIGISHPRFASFH